jgi:pimeloyl-ACP methyl ester carboxylesterase
LTADDGTELVAYHLGGDGPPVMLTHATGFHAHCWLPLASTLTPEFSVWALDQRGHGASGKAPDGQYPWSRFAADLRFVLDELATPGQPWRAGGHSMGGAVALMVEADRPGTFAAICAYEPVVFPDTGLPLEEGQAPPPLAVLARKRRPSFESRAAALANYGSKPPLNQFDPEALENYVEYGLVDAPDGTVTLACVREDEGAVFDGAAGNGVWNRLDQVRCPVTVLAGGSGMDPVGRIAPAVARQLPRGGYREFPALDHFGPMTAPYEVGRVMATALAGGHPPGAESTIAVTSPS